MELIIGVVGLAVAITLFVAALGFQADERSSVRASLRQLEGYDLQGVRDQELLNPLRDRAIVPLLSNLNGLARRLTPVGYVERVRVKHLRAGKAEPEYVDNFMVKKLVGVVLAPFSLYLVYGILDLSGVLGLLVAGLLVALCLVGPDTLLDREVEERTNKIQLALPEVLDLLVISVEAGLGFEQALDRVIGAVPGPLCDEFQRMLGEVRAGSSRSDAMRAMEARLDVAEVRSFILAMLQADTFGVSIGRMLRAQAEEMRVKRRQLAQEKAQKAPVKMLIPMVFCIFPALFVVVLGPAVIDIIDQLG